MGRIRNIKDVVEWGLCIGCGICYYACDKDAILLKNIYNQGIRAVVDSDKCTDDCRCLSFCPGLTVDAGLLKNDNFRQNENDIYFGPALEIWEGHAQNDEIRFAASSGGLLTALSLYCLEKEDMSFVLHTGMNPDKPWENHTVQSRNKEELISRTGSRYAPASPCDQLEMIQKSDRPCVFIGKPCDTTAVTMAKNQVPELDKKLGLILAFFCAGAPSVQGTLDMLSKFEILPEQVNHLRYRGNGWPGGFHVIYDNNSKSKFLNYRESWHELQKYRSFRCHLCPDGLGQISDLTCGDAWNRYSDNNDPGQSIVIVRTERGRTILHKAMDQGYLNLKRIDHNDVIAAQGLIARKPEIFGRLMGMKALFVPIPKFIGFSLFRSWWRLGFIRKIQTILGTMRRLIQRGFWHRKSYN